MSKSSHKALFTNPIILYAIGAVLVIAIGSGLYYWNSTRVPSVASLDESATTTAAVTASGSVEPAENPDLAFASGGRVTSVNASVGQGVYQGELLASLDTGALSAQRVQAEANVAGAQAQLAQMMTGARQQDIAAKQTAVDQANTALADLYVSVTTNILQAYDKAFSGISQDTDSLFDQPNSPNPALSFTTNNSQSAVSAQNARVAAESELSAWQTETNAYPPNPTPAQINADLVASLAHLQVLRTYGDDLLAALSDATPSTAFPQSAITAAQASVGTYRDSINTLISTLQNSQQQIASAQLAVQSAQDALNQTTASSTPDQIAAQQAAVEAAQASVDSINAQIGNDIITAPFSGTVASVQIKVGDVVTANMPAISLNPESALQISVYFSEIDITKVHVGAKAQVTLDAYGDARVFNAQVVSVDSAPSAVPGNQGQTGYKATLQFQKSDPAIVSGMTGNVTIPITQ